MKLLALSLLAYALIKLIRALPHTPESQPEPDEWTFEGDPWLEMVRVA